MHKQKTPLLHEASECSVSSQNRGSAVGFREWYVDRAIRKNYQFAHVVGKHLGLLGTV